MNICCKSNAKAVVQSLVNVIHFQLTDLLKDLLAQLLDRLLIWIVFIFVGLQGALIVLLILFVNGALSIQLVGPFPHLPCPFFCKLS